MKTRMVLSLFGVSLALILFNTCPGWSQPSTRAQLEAGTPGPIITRAYVAERGRYGDPLKIYIEADDPRGEMLRIATAVNQSGYGRYPTDWIYLKPQHQRHFAGYLQWNTFSSNAPRLREWTQLSLEVSVFDKAGRESNSIVFPLEFLSGTVSAPQPSPPFDVRSLPLLGHIDINLFEPTEMGRDRDRRHL
jgi:hypothetical protein